MIGIHEMAMGFLLLALSTSVPEIAVGVTASLAGHAPIAIGNVFGSNIANVCLVIGIAAIIQPLILRHELRETLLILFLTSLIPLVLLLLRGLSQYFGFGLIVMFLAFCWYGLKRGIALGEKPLRPNIKRLAVSYSLLLVGLFFVFISSHFAVYSASKLSKLLEILELVLGSTLVAVGTSLPEIAVGLAAIRRGNIDLAVGNVIGSSMVNITLVLGIALAFSPLIVQIGLFETLIIFSVMVNLILWFLFEKGKIGFTEGLSFLVLYWMFLMLVYGVQITLPKMII